jgi:Spy/CpxP family protein refolding chaperone
MKQELGLTDDQVEQLQKLHDQQRQAGHQRFQDMRSKRQELHQLLEAPSVDQKAVDAKAKELSDLQAAAFRDRLHAQIATRSILTPDQQKKMDELRASHRHNRRGGRQFRHRNRPQGGQPQQPQPQDGPSGD